MDSPGRKAAEAGMVPVTAVLVVAAASDEGVEAVEVALAVSLNQDHLAHPGLP